MDPTWYLHRLASMGPGEILHRTGDAARRRLWRSHRPKSPARGPAPERVAPIVPPGLTDSVEPSARDALLAEADGLLEGRWTMFGRPRTDMTADLDYFVDFVNRVRAPDRSHSFGIDHRDEASVGNVKFVWEPARHQHLTILQVR